MISTSSGKIDRHTETHTDRQTNRQTAGGRVTNTFLGRHVVVPAVHPWFETIRYADIDIIILHWNFSVTNLVCLSTCSRVLMVDVYSNCAIIIRWNTCENKSAQPRASAVKMTLPACAAERRAVALCHRSTAAGDRTVSKLLLRGCNGIDGRTDRRTPYRYIDSATHTMRAVAITGASATDSLTWLYLRRNYYRRIVAGNATCYHSVVFRIVFVLKCSTQI